MHPRKQTITEYRINLDTQYFFPITRWKNLNILHFSHSFYVKSQSTKDVKRKAESHKLEKDSVPLGMNSQSMIKDFSEWKGDSYLVFIYVFILTTNFYWKTELFSRWHFCDFQGLTVTITIYTSGSSCAFYISWFTPSW